MHERRFDLLSHLHRRRFVLARHVRRDNRFRGRSRSPRSHRDAAGGPRCGQRLRCALSGAHELAVEGEGDVVGNLRAGELAEISGVEHEQEG